MCTPALPDLKQCVHQLYQILNSVYSLLYQIFNNVCTPAQSGIGIRYPPRPPTPSIFAAALPIINNTSSAAEHLQLWGGGGGHEEKHRPDQK